MSAKRARGMVIPPLTDGRWPQLFFHVAYSVCARQIFNLPRPHWIALGCMVVAIIFDLAVGHFKFKKLVFPLSAATIGVGGCTLIYSPGFYFYWALVALAILSKALITYNGRHIFNPTNFAIVTLLLLFPGSVTSVPSLFSGGYWLSFIFFCTGSFTVFYARQALISFAWLGAFAGFGLLRMLLFGHSLALTIGPALAPIFLIFTFHMIGDPATTPKTPKWRLAFGASVALVDAVLRELSVPNSYFFALFAVYPFLPWVLESERTTSNASNKIRLALRTT